MINIDYLTLKAFFEENIDFFIGARLQKIQQPTRRDFVFSLRNNSETRKLYININPQIYHIAFMGVNGEKRRNIEIPKQPPMFCMLLRKYLEGCRISDALIVENERILELHFEIFDELSEKRSLCLAIELMGKHSNVILYDRETSIIIGCAHNVGAEKSRYRELQGGMKYIYPPKTNNSNPIASVEEQSVPHPLPPLGVNTSSLESGNLACKCSRKVVGELPDICPPCGESGAKYRRGVNGVCGFTPLYKILDSNLPLTEALDDYYSKIQEGINLKAEKSKLLAIVQAKMKKVKSSVDKVSALLKKRDNTEKYKLYGELLTANLYQNKDYSDNIEVLNYNTGENIVIELDSTKTLNENAQRYFKLYSKSKITKEKSTEILKGLEVEKEYLEAILYSIESAENLKDLLEIKSELGLIESKKIEKKENSVTKLEIKGFEVYIGKNNKQNDFIISKLSKDEDYWFHTRLCAGSHVLLKVQNEEPSEEVLFECCKLAREYSSAKQPSKVGVIYTKRKFIKKPPSAPLGYVIYKNEKEVLV